MGVAEGNIQVMGGCRNDYGKLSNNYRLKIEPFLPGSLQAKTLIM